MAEERAKKKKFFYGWLILVSGWLLTACITGMFVNCINQFVVPVCEALDISRTKFSITNSCISVAVMALSPFVGKVFEKIKPRIVVTVGAVVALTGWFGFSVASNVYMFYFFGLMIGAGSGFCGAVAVNILLNNWFHAKKGFAMGFATTGSGFGSMIFNPIIGELIAIHGYQVALRYMTVIAVLCVLPFLLLFKYEPAEIGKKPYGDNEGDEQDATKPGKKDVKMAQTEGLTRAEAIKNPRFWAVCVIACLLSFGVVALSTHMTPFFIDKGYDAVQAAAFMSIISFVMALTKIVFGWLNDKIGTYKNFLILVGIGTIGIGSLAFAGESLAIGYLSAVGFGIGFAATNVLSPLITVHAMGGKDFGNIFGIVSFAIYLGPLFASPFSGVVYDMTGTYAGAHIVCTACYAIAFILGFIVLRHGYGEGKDEEKKTA